MTVYALSDDDRRAATWMSEWSLVNDERIAGADIPAGYHEVTELEYNEALNAQSQRTNQQSLINNMTERMELAEKRRQLVAAGLSLEVARILTPDPTGDYSIDNA
jgi:hypothetical protein